jgi:glycosyltransferase involved in cell wall biosynthesis
MHAIHLLRKLNPAQWGGTETAIQRLCEGLREHGVKPIVYCPDLEEPASCEDLLLSAGPKVQRFKAFVPILGISEERKRQLISVGGNLMSFDLVSSLWRERDISVIHTHTLGRIGGIALTIAKQKRVPFVVTIHGGVFDLPAEMKKNFNAPADQGWEWGKLFGILFQSHRLFVDADAILTCNEKEAACLRERHPARRVVVQPHGVPVDIYQQDHRVAAKTAFPMIQGRDTLICVGRIDSIKNQHWLLEQMPTILKKHPFALLVLAGACTDEPYGAKINQTIKNLGLQNSVFLTGGLPPNDPRLIGLLQEARALLLPSLSETFGLVILEAWAAGIVVLSSRTSGASSLVRHGEDGWLFDLKQPETFHQALAQTLANPGQALRMAGEGASRVRAEYDIVTLGGRMRKLYEELIEEKRCVT